MVDLDSSSKEYAPAQRFVEAVICPRNINSPNSTLRFDVITLIDGWMRIIDLCVGLVMEIYCFFYLNRPVEEYNNCGDVIHPLSFAKYNCG